MRMWTHTPAVISRDGICFLSNTASHPPWVKSSAAFGAPLTSGLVLPRFLWLQQGRFQLLWHTVSPGFHTHIKLAHHVLPTSRLNLMRQTRHRVSAYNLTKLHVCINIRTIRNKNQEISLPSVEFCFEFVPVRYHEEEDEAKMQFERTNLFIFSIVARKGWIQWELLLRCFS